MYYIFHVNYGSRPDRAWNSGEHIQVDVLDEVRAKYRPDPKDGRIVQYGDGSNNLCSYPSRARMKFPEGNAEPCGLYGEHIQPGSYQAERKVDGGFTTTTLYLGRV